MRRTLTLALVAGGLTLGSLGAAPASAECYGAHAGATYVDVCRERVWEYQRWYLVCAIDTDGDGTADAACKKTTIIEYMGR